MQNYTQLPIENMPDNVMVLVRNGFDQLDAVKSFAMCFGHAVIKNFTTTDVRVFDVNAPSLNDYCVVIRKEPAMIKANIVPRRDCFYVCGVKTYKVLYELDETSLPKTYGPAELWIVTMVAREAILKSPVIADLSGITIISPGKMVQDEKGAIIGCSDFHYGAANS